MSRTPLRRITIGAIVLVSLLTLSVVGFRLAGRSWLDSLYMVVITISTVGFGETSRLPPVEKFLTMGTIVLGISATMFTLGGLLQMMTEGELERALHAGRQTRALDRMTAHVIICGFGRLGRILAEELRGKGQPLVVLDSSPLTIAEAEVLGHVAFLGDATEESVLQAVGVSRARCLVTALPNDAANVFITLTSRNLCPGLQIIARGENPSTQKKLLQAGANRVVLPAAIGALRIAAMITHPSTVELMELVAGRSVLDVEVDEITIPATSRLIGTTVIQTEIRRRNRLLVVAVKQVGGAMVFNPDGELVFRAGDVIIVMGRLEDIERFRQEYGL